MQLNFFKQKYNCELRGKCNENYKQLEDCLDNNLNDESNCKKELDSLKICIREFNKNFNKKYNGHSYYFLKDDVFTSK